MEYPGLTVIGHTGDPYMLDKVIAHEICHSWFYSALGSDERRFPFMDESITAAYESRYLYERYPGRKLWEIYFKNRRLAKVFQINKMPVQRLRELEWLNIARRNLEQPLNLPAPDYSIDYKMVRLKNKEILIKNKGEFKAPLLIAGVSGDSIFSEKWEDGFEGKKWITPVSDHYTEKKIDPGHKMPELFRLNNNIIVIMVLIMVWKSEHLQELCYKMPLQIRFMLFLRVAGVVMNYIFFRACSPIVLVIFRILSGRGR